MKTQNEFNIRDFAKSKRKTISISQEMLIKTGYLWPDSTFPLVIRPAIQEMNLAAWAASNLESLTLNLSRHGAILFRGFKVSSIEDFRLLMTNISGELLEYTYRSTPRTEVSGKVYTSTEYPPDHSIPLHNEMAYSLQWPMKIWFHCLLPAQEGGATPIADSRRVFNRISPSIRSRFEQKGVMYLRNYGGSLDLPWQKVFGTHNKADVEHYCHIRSIKFEWKDKDELRTRQVCQSTAIHPKTGERIWFNQAHLFHISSLHPSVQESLLKTFDEMNLPRNVYYGDGSAIESSALDEIRNAYEQESIVFLWEQYDVLMLDNMLAAHGRQPYKGERRVLVGMAEPYSLTRRS